MKKHFRILIILLISFLFCTSVNADSSFSAVAEVPDDITENQINVILGFYGDENMIVMEKLKYDSRYIEFDSVTAGEYFNVTVSDPVVDNYYKTITILADSDYAFDKYNFAQLTFNLTGKMKKGAETDIIVSDIKGLGTDKEIHKNNTSDIYIRRKSEGNIEYRYQKVDSSIKFQMFLRKNLLIIIIAIIAIIGILVGIYVLRRRMLLNKGRKASVSKDELVPPGTVVSNTAVIAPPSEQQNTQANAFQQSPSSPVSTVTPVQQAPVQQPVNVQPVAQPSIQPQPVQPQVSSQPVQQTQSVELNTQKDMPSAPVFVDSTNNNTVDATQSIAFGQSSISKEDNLNNMMEMPREKSNDVELPRKKAQSNSMSSIFSNSDDNSNQSQNQNNNMFSIVGILLICLSLLTFNVKADGVWDTSTFDIEGLRKCLVNNTCSKDYDYNSDNVVSVLDLLATKDLSRTVLEEEVGGNGHGFETIIYSRTTTTKSTKTTRGKNTTTKKPSGGVGGSKTTKATTSKTTKATTSKTARSTTEKTTKSTTSRTTKSTTVKSTTSKTTRSTTSRTTKATTTKAPVYSVKININYSGGTKNGKSESRTISSIKSGETKTVSYTANSAYNLAGISCSSGANVSYEPGKFIASNVNQNDTCTATFNWNQQVNVGIYVSYGKASQSSAQVKTGQSTTVKITPNQGYSCEGATVTPTNGVSSNITGDCNLNITAGSSDGKVTVTLVKAKARYTLNCMGSSLPAEGYVGGSIKYVLQLTSAVSSVSCSDGSQITKSLTSKTDTIYNYNFTLKPKNTSGTCTCS